MASLSPRKSEQPRLSTRLQLVLFGEQLASLQSLMHERTTACLQFTQKAVQREFTIDTFLPKGAPITPTESKAIKEHFKFFLTTVASLNVEEEHSARTLYNLIVRHETSHTKEKAYEEAVSYFGKINRAKFELLWMSALELFTASKRVVEKASSMSAVKSAGTAVGEAEFGSGVDFHPSVLDAWSWLDVPSTVATISSSSRNSSTVPKAVASSSSSSSSSSKFATSDKSNGSTHSTKPMSLPPPPPASTTATTTAVTSSASSSSNDSSNTIAQLLQLCHDHVSSTSFYLRADQLAEEIVKLLQKESGSLSHPSTTSKTVTNPPNYPTQLNHPFSHLPQPQQPPYSGSLTREIV